MTFSKAGDVGVARQKFHGTVRGKLARGGSENAVFCSHCGQGILDQAAVCVHCGIATGRETVPAIGKSLAAFILLGVFLGLFGIHNFYAGYTGKGIAQLLISLFTLPLFLFIAGLIVVLIVVFIWVIIEVCTVRQDARGVFFT